MSSSSETSSKKMSKFLQNAIVIGVVTLIFASVFGMLFYASQQNKTRTFDMDVSSIQAYISNADANNGSPVEDFDGSDLPEASQEADK